MSEEIASPAPGSEANRQGDPPSESRAVLASSGIAEGGSCGCKCSPKNTASSFACVYALGQIGYTFRTEARCIWFLGQVTEQMGNDSAENVLAYLEKNPWDAAVPVWTLNLEGVPIFAIHPVGPFADHGYLRLRHFLTQQIKEGVESVSVPGVIIGDISLMTRQTVPVVRPELRGMYSWTVDALARAAAGGELDEEARRAGIRNFLERVYFELRNSGTTSPERAINFSATHALAVGKVFQEAVREHVELDAIQVERSPISRPESDTWDVKLLFFDPREQLTRARKVYRFTVDVSDVIPFLVGKQRSWYVH